MKLLFDISYTQVGKYDTGIHVYGLELLDKLLNLMKDDIVVLASSKASLSDNIKTSGVSIEYIDYPVFSRKYYQKINELLINKYAKVFFPYQLINKKLSKKIKAQVLMTVHDLTPIFEFQINKLCQFEKKYLSGFKKTIKYLIKQVIRFLGIIAWRRKAILKHNMNLATKIFTDSYFSKNSIREVYGLDEKVIKIYPPLKSSHKATSKLDYHDYFLLISAHRYLKNNHLAIFALDRLYEKNPRKVIVLGNLPESIYKQIKNKEMIIKMGYISDMDLEYLYQNAYCFIFPSLSEGFGYPPLEAMAHGTKVITSDAMSLKELYGRTIQFDPFRIESLIDAISKIDLIKSEDMILIANDIKKKQEEDFLMLYEILKEGK